MGLAAFVRAVQLLAGLPLLLFPLYRILRISKSMTSIGMCVGGCVIIMSLLTTDSFFAREWFAEDEGDTCNNRLSRSSDSIVATRWPTVTIFLFSSFSVYVSMDSIWQNNIWAGGGVVRRVIQCYPLEKFFYFGNPILAANSSPTMNEKHRRRLHFNLIFSLKQWIG